GTQNLWEVFLGALYQALRPARLLRLEGRHLDRQLGRTFDVLQVAELPACKLRGIAEIGVFGERVVLPTSRVVNGLSPPHSRGAVEVEEHACARTSAMLKDEMSVEQNRL